MMPTDPKKRTIARSFADAFRGVGDCIKTERNMRIHLTLCVYVLFFASRMDLTRGELACLFLAIGSVMTAEALNTSVEKLCDFTQRHTNHLIRVIKDIAAGAVLICAVFAALVGIVVLFRPELWEAFWAICTQPVSLALFLLSLAVAALFVFLGPVKVMEQAERWFGGRKQ